MKILVLNLSMPDHRVEKESFLAKKAGNKVFFAGKCKENYESKIASESIYEKYFDFDITPRNRLGFKLDGIIERLQELTDSYDFDLVHAHNIYLANIASKLGIPVVFDDHEYHANRFQYLRPPISKTKDYVAHIIMKIRYPRWEKSLVKKFPIITVSKQIVQDYKKRYPEANVFFMPNAPLLEETDSFQKISVKKEDEIKSIYVGLNDFSSTLCSYRDTTGFLELWNEGDIGELVIIGDKLLKSSKNVKSLGFIPRNELFNEMSKAHLGIIGYRPHPFHYFINPNKVYNYVHLGLFLVAPKTILAAEEIVNKYREEMDANFGLLFSSFNDIKHLIKKKKDIILEMDYKKVQEIAKKHFVLNNYKENLTKAYKIAIEMQG